MFDNFIAYYHENVVNAFLEYRDTNNDGISGRSRDLRAAIGAASALFHLREHLPAPSALSRAEAERLCPDYGLLGDVVNVAKHKNIANATPHGAPLIDRAEDLEERIDIFEYEDDIGVYKYVQKVVIVKLTDGSERVLLKVLTTVLNFWEQYLHQHGILQSARSFTHDSDVRFRSRAECGSSRLDFEIEQGQRWKQTLRLLRFDSATGQANPIDLTGHQVSVRIYQPQKLLVDISLTDPNGTEFKETISLTDHESIQLTQLSTDVERQAFVQTLPTAINALERVAARTGLRVFHKPGK